MNVFQRKQQQLPAKPFQIPIQIRDAADHQLILSGDSILNKMLLHGLLHTARIPLIMAFQQIIPEHGLHFPAVFPAQLILLAFTQNDPSQRNFHYLH